VLRPWWFAMRQSEDRWNLKPLALLVVLPCLLHNLSEASVGDFLGKVGLLFGISWAVAERYRLLMLERGAAERRKTLDRMPPAIVALHPLSA